MNASKPEKLRYWLTIMLDDLPLGTIFEPGRLHVTLLPWFVTEMDEPAVINSFENRFSKINKFSLQIGDQKMFGPKHNVGVNLIEENADIINLHNLSLEWFGQIDARWAVKNPHVDDDYKPHIRRRRGSQIRTGEILEINNLFLIKAARTEDGKRVVVAKINLL